MAQILVEIFTEGACSGNPGPGGWVCIIRPGDEAKLTSGDRAATDQRMELMPAIAALEFLDSLGSSSLARRVPWRDAGWPRRLYQDYPLY